MLSYRVFADAKSLYNTPPSFSIYMVKLVTDWLLAEIGSLEKMRELIGSWFTAVRRWSS